MNSGYNHIKACVITPIWKEELNENELRNILYSLNFTKGHAHAFICPESLDVGFYELKFENSRYLRFPDFYFNDITGYNILLQSYSFYEKFLDLDFIVILQTDAILVKAIDSLLTTKYDYIAAPWENGLILPFFIFKSKVFTFFLKTLGFRKKCFIGNGGLSIRRVTAFANLCKKFSPIKWLNEDMLFGLFAARGFIKVPSLEVSKKFFFERSEIHIEKLPDVYGYHAIEKYYPEKYHLMF